MRLYQEEADFCRQFVISVALRLTEINARAHLQQKIGEETGPRAHVRAGPGVPWTSPRCRWGLERWRDERR